MEENKRWVVTRKYYVDGPTPRAAVIAANSKNLSGVWVEPIDPSTESIMREADDQTLQHITDRLAARTGSRG